MCGLAGFYASDRFFSEIDLKRMGQSLVHRGPDAYGNTLYSKSGIAHQRLSIIDLSEKANQPMKTTCGRYEVVFNGEIYNFKELLQELAIEPQTSSDTELVLYAFVKWGMAFVHKLNGMFSIAIYDNEQEELFLFRDRIGIKPLFYFWDGSHFAFASEIKALLKAKNIALRKKINYKVISNFLYLGYIPEPETIYQNIYKFPAGYYARVNANLFELSPYWEAEKRLKKNVISNEQQAKKELKQLLINSIQGQMISDVPFGTFLSGGIDSSLVTAIAQSLSSTPVNTFSIGFKESKYNESKYAKKVAEYLSTNHHEFIVSYSDAIELLPDFISYYDEPFADSSGIPTMLVSKLAKEHVTMTLAGDGGDELFFGYGSYKWAKRLENPFSRLLRKPAAGILAAMPERYRRASHLFKYPNYSNRRSHIFSQEQYFFTAEEIVDLMLDKNIALPTILKNDIPVDIRTLDTMEEQAIFDLKYYLKDDLLVKVDRASMRYSLETRVPLLDHNIVEFAINLSSQLKIKNNEAKYILKEILYDYVPKSYFNRPKWGFSMPINEWLKNELKFLIDEYLSEKMVNGIGLVDYKKVERMKNQFLTKDNYLYNRIWLLIVLHKWMYESY